MKKSAAAFVGSGFFFIIFRKSVSYASITQSIANLQKMEHLFLYAKRNLMLPFPQNQQKIHLAPLAKIIFKTDFIYLSFFLYA